MDIETASYGQTGSVPSQNETKQALQEMMMAFESFKEANDERLDNLEKNKSEDVLVRDKVDRINKSLDSLMTDLRRPSLSHTSEAAISDRDVEAKAAFVEFLKSGYQSNHHFEKRSLTEGVDTDGGYTVPSDFENVISNKLADASPIRKHATVKQISVGNEYKKVFSEGDFNCSWVYERSARDTTNTPSMREVSIDLYEQYCNPAASPLLLEDSAMDIEAWLLQSIHNNLSELEDKAFINGTGAGQPKGIVKWTFNSNSTSTWNKLTGQLSGETNKLKNDDYGASYISLIYSLPAAYRANARFLMNRSTQAELRMLRDEAGNYLWIPPTSSDHDALFMGYPIIENENMPNVATGEVPIVFADFRAGYVVVDKLGTSILRDPYSNKPYVMFYTTRRVGGGIQDFHAFRAIKIS